MATFSHWRGVAQSSGAAGLASIVDGTSSDDPSGTDCNKAYWESKAYDQLVALFTSLSSAPGSGVDGNFTINQDATSSANSSLSFGTGGTLVGGEPSLTWVSSTGTFNLTHDLVSQINLGSSSTRLTKVFSTDADISGTLTLGGSSTLTSTGSATFSNLTVNTLSLGGNIQTDGVSLTLNADYTGSSPSENGSIIVERGTQSNAILRFTESSDRWQIYDLGTSAYKDIAIFDSNGFTYTEMFSGTGGNLGTANTVARSDHSHSFGTVGAQGTTNTFWDIDSDYSSGSSNIEARFGGSARFIRINPNDSTPLFSFSHGLSVASLTITSGITFSGSSAISGDLPVSGDEITFLSTNSGSPSSNADLVVNRGTGTDTRIRWNETDDRWTFSNDGSTYFRLIGTDGSDNLTAPANLTITGDITGSLTSQGSEATLRNNQSSGGEASFRVKIGVSTFASLKWDNSNSKWQVGNGSAFSDIITNDGAQTLTSKTLTSPTISQPSITNGGSWGGNPAYTGNPTFSGTPAFSGTPTFVGATFSGRPAFNADYTAAPFTVGQSTTVVTNLNADRVDGKHVDDTQSASTSYLWTSDKIQTQINASSNTPGAHASSHESGGSDPIDGILQISGTTNNSFTINTDGSTAGTLQLGSGSLFRLQIKDSGRMGVAGTNIAVVPQSTGQTLGDSSNRWDQIWANKYINSNLITTSDYPTTNGSLWFSSAVGSGGPSLFLVRLGGSNFTVVDSNGDSSVNADKVDGKHVDDSQSASTSYLWTSDKINTLVGTKDNYSSWNASTNGTTHAISSANTLDFVDSTGITTSISDSGTTTTLTIEHSDTSSQSSVTATGNSSIRSVSVDTLGHVTGLTTYNPFTDAPAFNPASGTVPFTTNATGVVTNLNADQVDGKHVDDSQTSTGYLWTANKIQSEISSHSHSYLSTSGGTISGGLTVSNDLNVSSSLLYVASGYGRVGIGFTPPDANGGKLEVFGGSSFAGTGESIAKFRSQGSDARIHINSTSVTSSTHKAFAIYEDGNTASKFSTGLDGGAYKITTGIALSGTQRQKIDSSGNFEFGEYTDGKTYDFIGDEDMQIRHLFHPSGNSSFDNAHYSLYAPGVSGFSAQSVFVVNASSISNTPGYTLRVHGTIGHNGSSNASDRRIKQNIEPITGALDAVTKLQGISYNWRDNPDLDFKSPTEDKRLGFVAQDVEEVIPEVVTTSPDSIKAINSDGILPVLLEAIKELKAEVDALKAGQ